MLTELRKVSETLPRRGLSICFSGIDGCGKTTLSTQLSNAIGAAGIPVRRLHIYHWYHNVFTTPAIIIYNRFVGRRVLIFDRTIYDNLVVAGVASPRLRRYLPLLFRLLRTLYPGFDFRYYLHVSFDQTMVRRPNTEHDRFFLLEKIYELMMTASRWHVLKTDRDVLEDVIEALGLELV